MGLFYYVEEKNDFIKNINEQVNELIKYFAFEIADLKYILIDIDAATRGLAGIKKILNYNDLPSCQEKNKIIIEEERHETPEEKLARHKKFFNELKKSFLK